MVKLLGTLSKTLASFRQVVPLPATKKTNTRSSCRDFIMQLFDSLEVNLEDLVDFLEVAMVKLLGTLWTGQRVPWSSRRSSSGSTMGAWRTSSCSSSTEVDSR